MAYTLTTVQTIGRDNGTTAALVATFEAAAGIGAGNGNYFDNDGRRKFIFIKNASGSLLTVTIKTSNTRDGDLTLPDATFTVAAGADSMWGEAIPSPYEQTEQAVTKAILIEWDATTSITFAVIELPTGVEGA